MINFRNLFTIFKRELRAYFDSVIAYIYIIVFVIFLGSLFMTQFFLIGQAEMRPFFSILPLVLCVFVPAITMRLWASDKQGNTFELLLTFPVRPQELVLGKFLASLAFYFCALAATLPIPIMIAVIGSPDSGPIIGGYLGALLIGSFFLAVGIFVSGMCKDQIVAFILAMIFCFGFFLVGTEFMASSLDGWVPGLGSFLSKFFGLIRHYGSFEKGVIDTRSLFYFIFGTAVFLVLNTFFIDARMRPRARTTFSTAVILCVGIMALINWLFSDISLGRFDLTGSKIYTTSPVTRTLFKKLKVPVTVKYYVSSPEKMPTGLKTLEQDVVDKLGELRDVSGGKFKYKLFHMEAAAVRAGSPESEETSLEQQLQKKGVQPFQVQSIEADELGIKMIYSAISIVYKEKPEEIIPQVVPGIINDLEYLLVSRIYRLTMDREPEIALMAPYSEYAVDPKAINLLSQLGMQIPPTQREDKYRILPRLLDYEGYKVRRIQLAEEENISEPDFDTLVVIQPEELNQRQLFEINRFLVEGGSLLVAFQNYNIEYLPSRRGIKLIPRKLNDDLNSLISNWGVEVSEDILMDVRNRMLNIHGIIRGPLLPLTTPVKAPVHIEIDQEGMDEEISITSSLSPLLYLWGSALKLDEEKIAEQKLTRNVILNSSAESWEVEFSDGPLAPEDFNPPASGTGAARPLAVLLRGQFSDAFAGNPVPEWPKDKSEEGEESPEKEAEEVVLNKQPGQLLVVGCSTLFQENFFGLGSHKSFFVNAVDALTLGEDLIKVRSKRIVTRTIERVSTAQKVIWRFFATLLTPVVLVFTGSIHLFMRKQAKRKILTRH